MEVYNLPYYNRKYSFPSVGFMYVRLVVCLMWVITWAVAGVSAQDLSIRLLARDDGQYVRTIFPSREEHNWRDYNGLSLSNYKLSRLVTTSFNGDQYAYQKMGMSFLISLYPELDTTFIYKGTIQRNDIAAFVGLDSLGAFHAVIDKNNNRDFSDDQWFYFEPNTSDSFKVSVVPLDCSITYYNGLTLQDTVIKFDVEFITFPSLKDPKSNLSAMFQIKLLSRSYKYGELIYKGKPYSVYVKDNYYNLYPSFDQEYELSIRKLPEDTLVRQFYKYASSSGDLVRIENDLFRIPRRIRESITFRFVKKAGYSGGAVGQELPSATALDLQSDKTVRLNINPGKYTFVDFWASWCLPCISSFPDLKALKNRFTTDQFELISIAVDDLKNKQKIKEIIRQNQLDWRHLYMNSEKEGGEYLKKVQIQAFPASILINPWGKVIYRGISTNAFTTIDSILSNVIK